MGLRFETSDRFYDPDPGLAMQLIEIITDDPSYSDGEPYDSLNSYDIESGGMNGPCEYLKASINYELRDTKCHVKRSFICQWSGLTCPPGYVYLGPHSTGRTCHGVNVTNPDTAQNTVCDSPDDLLRSRWNPENYAALARFRESRL